MFSSHWQSFTVRLLSLRCHLTYSSVRKGARLSLEYSACATRRRATYTPLACSRFVWNPLCILSHTRLSQSQTGLTHWTRGRALIGQHPRGPSVTRCSISPAGTNNKEKQKQQQQYQQQQQQQRAGLWGDKEEVKGRCLFLTSLSTRQKCYTSWCVGDRETFPTAATEIFWVDVPTV